MHGSVYWLNLSHTPFFSTSYYVDDIQKLLKHLKKLTVVIIILVSVWIFFSQYSTISIKNWSKPSNKSLNRTLVMIAGVLLFTHC